MYIHVYTRGNSTTAVNLWKRFFLWMLNTRYLFVKMKRISLYKTRKLSRWRLKFFGRIRYSLNNIPKHGFKRYFYTEFNVTIDCRLLNGFLKYKNRIHNYFLVIHDNMTFFRILQVLRFDFLVFWIIFYFFNYHASVKVSKIFQLPIWNPFFPVLVLKTIQYYCDFVSSRKWYSSGIHGGSQRWVKFGKFENDSNNTRNKWFRWCAVYEFDE